MRFGDFEVVLIRDPTEGPDSPPKLLIRLGLEYTKQYLGPKATYVSCCGTSSRHATGYGPGHVTASVRCAGSLEEHPILGIIYDPSMLLGPNIFLLAIISKQRVFTANALNNDPNLLSTLMVPEDCFELPLLFRDEVKRRHVFRQAAKTTQGLCYMLFQTSLCLICSFMKDWFKRIGMLSGFETNTICCVLRSWEENNLNQRSKLQRNIFQ